MLSTPQAYKKHTSDDYKLAREQQISRDEDVARVQAKRKEASSVHDVPLKRSPHCRHLDVFFHQHRVHCCLDRQELKSFTRVPNNNNHPRNEKEIRQLLTCLNI